MYLVWTVYEEYFQFLTWGGTVRFWNKGSQSVEGSGKRAPGHSNLPKCKVNTQALSMTRREEREHAADHP